MMLLVRSIDGPALIALRNAVAIAHIVQAWPRVLAARQGFMPVWSDYFSVYPVRPAKDKGWLVTVSPSVSGLDEFEDFRGQSSPLLPHPSTIHFRRDDRLLEGLLRLWRRRFEQGRFDERRTRILFRSLEVAFQAASVPSANYSTIYDFGTGIALWVSAFEVLSHPWRGRANLGTVLDLLAQYTWKEPRIRRRRFRIRYGGQSRASSRPQKYYHELYRARNSFLHGEPVSARSLRSSSHPARPHLLVVAPMLYRAALYASLANSGARLREPIVDLEGSTYERAMLKLG
jgi:hypothetical protein